MHLRGAALGSAVAHRITAIGQVPGGPGVAKTGRGRPGPALRLLSYVYWKIRDSANGGRRGPPVGGDLAVLRRRSRHAGDRPPNCAPTQMYPVRCIQADVSRQRCPVLSGARIWQHPSGGILAPRRCPGGQPPAATARAEGRSCSDPPRRCLRGAPSAGALSTAVLLQQQGRAGAVGGPPHPRRAPAGRSGPCHRPLRSPRAYSQSGIPGSRV
jgi:hypothetical protein